MSTRFNYFMATPYSNPSRKAQKISKTTNELPKDEKIEEVVEKQTPKITDNDMPLDTVETVVFNTSQDDEDTNNAL